MSLTKNAKQRLIKNLLVNVMPGGNEKIIKSFCVCKATDQQYS